MTTLSIVRSGWLRRICAGLMIGTMAVLAGLGTARMLAPAADHQSAFAAQARADGLSAAQARTIQERVDANLARMGGVQIAANEIRLPHGGDLLLTLPGETVARHLTGPAAHMGRLTTVMAATSQPSAPANGSACWPTSGTCCSHLYICGWSQPNGFGDVVSAFYCGVDVEVPNSFTGNGSWINNQSSGTRAHFEGAPPTRRVVYTTAPAYSFGNPYNWHPVWYIDACGST